MRSRVALGAGAFACAVLSGSAESGAAWVTGAVPKRRAPDRQHVEHREHFGKLDAFFRDPSEWKRRGPLRDRAVHHSGER